MLWNTLTLTCYYCHESCSERSDSFLKNLGNRLKEELIIDCKYYNILGIIKFEDALKSNNIPSKYEIVIFYACSQDTILVLPTELTSRSYLQNGILWASQGEVSEESVLHLIMDFTSNDWKKCETDIWKELIEEIRSEINDRKEKAVRNSVPNETQNEDNNRILQAICCNDNKDGSSSSQVDIINILRIGADPERYKLEKEPDDGLLKHLSQLSESVLINFIYTISILIITLVYFVWRIFYLIITSFKIKKPIRPIGLENTYETCYMNSMVQAMAASPILIAKQLELLKFVKSNGKLQMLINLLNAINGNNHTVKDTTDMLISFMNSIQWNRRSQQDAFQLLSFFINGVQKDLDIKDKTLSPKLRILHSFSENPRYNKIQDHLGLAIPLCGEFRVRPGVLLKELLNAFFAPSEIDDGPNSTQLYLYGEAPDVMILHVQANEWSEEKGDYIKPEYHIVYEKILEYDFIIQKEKDGSKSEKSRVKYKLVAVVHHMGGVQGGHYITYRMLGDHWFLTNDEQVEKVEFECGVTPYIMVYEKTTN